MRRRDYKLEIFKTYTTEKESKSTTGDSLSNYIDNNSISLAKETMQEHLEEIISEEFTIENFIVAHDGTEFEVKAKIEFTAVSSDYSLDEEQKEELKNNFDSHTRL